MIILLKRAYDAALDNFCVIVMSTLPYKAPKLPTKLPTNTISYCLKFLCCFLFVLFVKYFPMDTTTGRWVMFRNFVMH